MTPAQEASAGDTLRPDGAPVIAIHGEKVALGPLRHDLLPLYQRWNNDLATTRTLGRPGPTTLEQEQVAYEAAVRDEHLVMFTVYDAATGQPIGLTYLGEIDDRHRTAEFGLVIGEAAFRGRGYGTEATRLVLDYAFTVRGLHNVGLSVYAYNHAGQRAYARAGFREVGRRRQARRLGSQPWDVIYMDCLATDFVSPLLAGTFLAGQKSS
jgi:RimJ/RimL family protein N-acetyltransferase